jgi:hypothetical protein
LADCSSFLAVAADSTFLVLSPVTIDLSSLLTSLSSFDVCSFFCVVGSIVVSVCVVTADSPPSFGSLPLGDASLSFSVLFSFVIVADVTASVDVVCVVVVSVGLSFVSVIVLVDNFFGGIAETFDRFD